ncbi:Ionotropic receptor 110, partial [Frankliniella occidentalis]
AHRPLSAVWLLMSVVLAAAYQGLLLRELTSPPPEIDSLEQLEQSGLDVYADEALYPLDKLQPNVSHSLTSRIQYFNPATHHITVLERVLNGQNSALICRPNMVTSFTLAHLPKNVHKFVLPNSSSLMATIIYTKESPFGQALHLVLSWFQSSALLRRYLNVAEFHAALHTASADAASELTRPLSLGQLQPAFCLLAAGCVLSAVAFVLEVLCHRWSHRHAPPVPVFLH